MFYLQFCESAVIGKQNAWFDSNDAIVIFYKQFNLIEISSYRV